MSGRKTKIIAVIAVVILIILGSLFILNHNKPTSTAKKTTTASPTPAENQSASSSSFDKTTHSTTDPTSIWVVVNKQHPLQPKSYVPADLVTPNIPLRVPGNESMQVRKVTATALEAMLSAAKQENISLMLSSGYRSYNYQVTLYNGYVKTEGQATADTQSARPGYSEHQTGLAADIEPASKKCEVDQCFKDTPEGVWLAANAYKYGFIIRYPADKTDVTGYEYEPWHVRYVGTDLSNEMRSQGIETLEEFFNITGGKSY